MKIVVGADKGGFALKQAILELLQERGAAFCDVGTVCLDEPKNFSDVAKTAASMVSRGEAERGILVCGTGMGMAITANKFKGVRAAVVESLYAASYARRINDANVLCLGGFMIAPSMGREIVEAFLDTDFVQDFPKWRVDFLHGQREVLEQIEAEVFR